MKIPLLLLATSGPSIIAAQIPTEPVELRVLISPGFAAAYDALVPEFERARGVRIVTGRGGSTGSGPGAIPGRVASGEAVDVVIVADEGMDEIVASGGVLTATRQSLGRTSVGVAVPRGLSRPDVSTPEALRRALIEAASVVYSSGPSGTHLSRVVLPELGISAQVEAKAVITNNVPAALVHGEAEIGFQQVSELVAVEGIAFVGPLPEELQLRTAYSAAVATRSPQRELAVALIEFLTGPSTDALVSRMGLERADSGPR